MLPAKPDRNQDMKVGFPMPTEDRRLSSKMRAINGAVVVFLAAAAVWYCFQIQIWNLGNGTFFEYFLHRYWGLIPVLVSVLPVAAYSVPMLYLQEKKKRKHLIEQNQEIRKLR